MIRQGQERDVPSLVILRVSLAPTERSKKGRTRISWHTCSALRSSESPRLGETPTNLQNLPSQQHRVSWAQAKSPTSRDFSKLITLRLFLRCYFWPHKNGWSFSFVFSAEGGNSPFEVILSLFQASFPACKMMKKRAKVGWGSVKIELFNTLRRRIADATFWAFVSEKWLPEVFARSAPRCTENKSVLYFWDASSVDVGSFGNQTTELVNEEHLWLERMLWPKAMDFMFLRHQAYTRIT